MPFVVLTGGPHAGKTTLINELKALGHPVIPEVAIDLIEQLNQKLGVPEQVAWRTEHIAEFERQVLREQLKREAEFRDLARRAVVFCDRGVWDVVAYCRVKNVPFPHDDVPEGAVKYLHAFVLDTLPSFSARSETGRISTIHDSQALRDGLLATYTEFNVAVTLIPVADISQRLKLIDRTLAPLLH